MTRTVTVRPVSKRTLTNRLRELRSMRQAKADLEKTIPEIQALAVEMLDAVDPDGVGYHWSNDDIEGKNYARVTQASGTTVWDTESLVDYLHKNGLWDECSTRVLDIAKVEMLIKSEATSTVEKKLLLGFTREGPKPKPYVSFINKPKATK